VGVPLAVLPDWAQKVAGFMPGRYAVHLLDRTIADPRGLSGCGFDCAALVVIGIAAGAVGTKLFRWENRRRLKRADYVWVATALAAWLAVGAAAAATGRLQPVGPSGGYDAITPAQIDAIVYDDLPGDNEIVSRLARPFRTDADSTKIAGFVAQLKSWPPAQGRDPGQNVRLLVGVATVADIVADPREAEIARATFDELKARYDRETLARALAWVILDPDEGSVRTNLPELGLHRHPPERLVRQRLPLYAKKYLGRLMGKLRD
jgi:ABC-2 type transport system permease protein